MSNNNFPVKKLIRIENLILLAVVLFAYHELDGNWLVFAFVLFMFDVSMVGYLVNNKLGRITYNIGHSYALPLLLLLLSWNNDWSTALLVSLIWLAHISIDRTLGYGLKLQDFHHTHLGNIGKN